MDIIVLFKEEFGKIRTVLASDTGNERNLARFFSHFCGRTKKVQYSNEWSYKIVPS